MNILADCRKGGICRNLKNIINAMRLGDFYKLSLVIFWPDKIRVMNKQHNSTISFVYSDNIKFNDIIQDIKYPFKLVTDLSQLKKYRFKMQSCTHEIQPLPSEITLLPEHFSELQYLINNNYMSLTYEFENIPQSIRNNIVEYFKKIVFNTNISTEVESFIKQHKQERLIGVTIRTWPEHNSRRK